MSRFMTWSDGLAKSGKAKSSQSLAGEGKTVSGKNGRIVADGPFVESKEAIGGCLLLQVDNFDEALDVFVLDQARYFYDSVPTLPLLVERLRFPDQWILRVCMDGIFRHTAEVCREWFSASTVAEMGTPGFHFHHLSKREQIAAETG